MYTLSVCLFSCVSVVLSKLMEPGFHYTKTISMFRRTTDEECKLCFGDDCVSINEARCDYNMAIAELEDKSSDDIQEVVNDHLKTEVDSRLFNVIEKAAEFTAMECIPLISQYTDCTKDNTCIGCHTCSCKEDGKWNCSIQQHCRAESSLTLTHQNILMAIENLKNDYTTDYRKKRSIKNATEKEDTISNMTFSELFEWLSVTQPLNVHGSINDTIGYSVDNCSTIASDRSSDEGLTINNGNINKDIVTRESNKLKLTTKSDPEYLAFEEVLKDIAGDFDHTHSGNTLDIIEQNPNIGEDYMDFVMNSTIGISNITTVVQNNNDIETTEATTGFTDMVIDLLNVMNNNIEPVYNQTDKDYYEIKINPLDNNDDNAEINMNALNLKKRDITEVLDKNTTRNGKERNNITNVLDELKDNVLSLLNSIVDDKQNELQDLLQVKNSLLGIIKNLSMNNSSDVESNKIQNNDTVFSIYKLEIVPEYQLDFRRDHENHKLLDKYLDSLKQDIMNVIRGAARIQELVKASELPEELIVLIRTMKYYIRKQQKTYFKKKGDKKRRRHWDNYSYVEKKAIKNAILEILSLIDKESLASNILSSLSNKSQILLNRIIKQNQIDDLSVIEIKIKDNYNLINDLVNVGSKWQEMTERITESSPFDRIYNMKLLHLILSVDINKMNDALKLLDFSHSRRINIESDTTTSLLTKVNNKLKVVNSNLQKIIDIENKKHRMRHIDTVLQIKPNKKQSFLKQIKNLIKTSKKDIINLFNKNVSNSEIIKEFAKKKLDKLTRRKMIEYEDTLLRWQNNLKVITRRRKRTAYEFMNNMKHRIKSILPTYLRGKVNPAIIARRKNKSHQSHNKSIKSKVTTKTS